jgi:hypothetical protein
MRGLVIIVVLVLVATLVAGCSKRGSPTAPSPILSPGTFSVTPDTLTISNAHPVGSLSITTSSTAGENWHVDGKPSWLQAAPDSGFATQGGQSVAVTVDTTGLAYGTAWGTVTFSTPTHVAAAVIRLLNPAPIPKLYGLISTSRTLTAAFPGPTYDVIGDLTVAPGATLTVEPGVTLNLSPNFDFLGSGRNPSASELIVHGTLVIGNDAGALATVYGAMSVESDGSIIANHTMAGALVLGIATFNNCTIGGVEIQGGTATISHSTFPTSGIVQFTGAFSVSDCDIGGVLAHGGEVTASRCRVGPGGFVCEGATFGTIQECDLVGSDYGTGIALCAGITTTAPDTTNVRPTTVRGFETGVSLSPGATARNILVSGTSKDGIVAAYGNGTVNYCTIVGSRRVGIFMSGDSCMVLNSIVVNSGSYGVLFDTSTSRANYSDSWNNHGNWVGSLETLGSSISSYDPSFTDATSYRLSGASMFLHFSVSGGQIGAYGPGQ